MEAFARVLARLKEAKDTPVIEARRIVRDEYTIPRCTQHILKRLRKGNVEFSTLISDHPTREEVVTLFLALLELIRLGKTVVVQDTTYDEILLMPAENIDSDVEVDADGYQ